MVTIRQERASDVAARDALLDIAFGAERLTKTSERLREGNAPARGLAFVATENGRVIGTVRLWPILAGANRPALLLGPLAVAADRRNEGIGGRLMRHALRKAGARGHRAVLLVGDASYYGRFGFAASRTRELRMPGAYEPERLLGVELVPGALDGASGIIRVARDARADQTKPLIGGLQLGAARFALSTAA